MIIMKNLSKKEFLLSWKIDFYWNFNLSEQPTTICFSEFGRNKHANNQLLY